MAKRKPGSSLGKKAQQNVAAVKEELSITSILIKAAIFGALFLPLVFFVPLYDIYDLSKVTVLRLLTISIVCLLVVNALSGRRIDLPRTKFALPVAVLMLLVLLSTIFSINPIYSILGGLKRHEGLTTHLSYLLIFWLAATYFHKRESSKVEIILGIAVIAQSIYGISQRLGYDVIDWSGSGYDVNRAFGSTGNPVFLGQYLALVTPFFIGQIIYSENASLQRNIFRVLAAVLAIACSLFTYSRASWVGIAVAVLFLMPVFIYHTFFKNLKAQNEQKSAKKSSPKNDTTKKMMPLILAGIVIVGVILISVVIETKPSAGTAAQPLADRAKSMTSTGGTVGTRISMWSSSLKIIKEKPVLGYGLETFKGIFPKYRELRLIQLEGEMSMPDRPHNEYLYLIYSWGILGFTAFIWILIAFSWKAIKYLLSKDPTAVYKGFVVSTLAAIISYNVANFFSFSTANSTPTYWLLMGFASSLMWNGDSRVVKLPAPPVAFKYIMYSVLTVWALVFTWYTFQFPLADLHYNKARFARAYNNLEVAQQEGEASVKTNPYQALYRIELASIYQALGNSTQDPQYGIKIYELFNAGSKFDPNDQDTWANLGGSMFGANANPNMSTSGMEKVIDYYKKAIALDPYYSIANERLSNVYFSLGRFAEAKPYLEKLVAVQPSSAFGLAGLGKVYEVENNTAMAKDYYDRSIQVDPNNQIARDGLKRITN